MSLFGLGKPTPSRFPYPRRPQPSGAAPGPGNVIRAKYVIVFGTGGGVFVYSGTPGFGNPPIGWVSAANTDPYGNSLPGATQPIGVFGSGVGETTLGAGSIGLSHAGAFGGASMAALNSQQFNILSPVNSGGDTAAEILMNAASVNGAVAQAIFTLTGLVSTAGTRAHPSLLATDSWTTITTFGTGFAAGTPAPSYALLPYGVNGGGAQGAVAVRGQVAVTAAVSAGNSMFTLPFTFGQLAAFASPNSLSGYALGHQTFSINPGGSVTVQVAGVNGNNLLIDGGINFLN